MNKPRKKLWKRLAIGFGVLLALLVAAAAIAFFEAPNWVRKKIEARYPGVSVGQVKIFWLEREVDLRDVKVDREHLKAEFPFVHVRQLEEGYDVTVPGGHVDLTLVEGEKPAGLPASEKVVLHVDNIDVTVHARGIDAELLSVQLGAEDVCFASGTLTHPRAKARLGKGCAAKDRSSAELSSVEVDIELPYDLPEVPRAQTIAITGVKADLKAKVLTIGELSMGKTLGLHNATLRVDARDLVSVKAEELHIEHVWVAPHPVAVRDIETEVPLSMIEGGTKVPFVLHLGSAELNIDSTDRAISGSETCSGWFDALPKPLPESMEGMAAKFKGTLDFEIRVKPAPKVSIKSSCAYDCSAEPIKTVVDLWKGPGKMTYAVYNAKNELDLREVGPKVPLEWAPMKLMKSYVPQAFVLLEDPGFLDHRGVIPQALENSLRINLEKGGFMRGGSTITMQLAKNLWLSRNKSFVRKVDEALLAYALESCLPKDRILELYMNVVEFGPNLYGIGPAARFYFKKNISELTPVEAFFLASILPSPRKALPPKQGGLDKAKRIMKSLAKMGVLPEFLGADDDTPVDTTGWELSP